MELIEMIGFIGIMLIGIYLFIRSLKKGESKQDRKS